MREELDVAVIQLVSTDDWQHNLERITALLEQAVAFDAPELVLLPENALCFGGAAQQEMAAGIAPILAQIGALAVQFSVYLVVGSVPLPYRMDGSAVDGRCRASSLVFGPNGDIAARYDKIHLFDVDVADAQGGYRESESYEAGDTIVTTEVAGWSCGMSVCYDLRFPELYLNLAQAGSELIFVPAAFTAVTGEAHWEPLLRARAIETQSYILAANQGGRHNAKRETWGQSMIIDPWGRIVMACDKGEAVIKARLCKEELRRVRSEMPVATHRRVSYSAC